MADPRVTRALMVEGDLLDPLDLVAPRPSWHTHAACRGQGPGRWFLDRGQPARPALDVCQTCAVRRECLDAALSLPPGDDLSGIWGGTTPNQRKALRKARTAAAA